MKLASQREIYIPVFISSLFIIVKIWKQPKQPSAGIWGKMWYVDPMEKNSALKKDQKKKIISFSTR